MVKGVAEKYLAGGGEMGALIRSKNWEQTCLGHPDTWPQSLLAVLGLMLHSRFPMFLWWGPELSCFYNDAYRPSLGVQGKHPGILGMPAKEAWTEIWPIIEPLINQVIEGGEATWQEDSLIPIHRNGKIEDVYWTFSYSPVFDESGKISGVFVTCYESTEKVIVLKKLEEAEQRARLAVEAGNLGTFDLNLVTDEIYYSPRLNAIFGFDCQTKHPELLSRVHPEDLEIRNLAMEQGFIKGKMFYEVRIIHPDNSIRWIRAEGKVIYDDQGKPARLLGTILDCTDQHETEQKREEYIAIASHELRNPLSSLKLSMDMLAMSNTNEDRELFISKAASQVKRLMTMTHELLNVSKISSGIVHLNAEIFNLRDCIAECIQTFRAGKNSNPFRVTGKDDVNIRGDKFRIEQVLINLISNASKYSAEGSPINIDVSAGDGRIKVSVTDQGIGIDAGKLKDVFRKFIRIESGSPAFGYGLGLYISQQIVQKHGGEMGVESEKGKGSTFWFTLPF